MSFNARLFNHYKWIDNENIPSEIKRFFSFENPDLIAIQEYHRDYQFVTSDFKYKYVYFSGSNSGKSIHTNKEIVGEYTALEWDSIPELLNLIPNVPFIIDHTM